MASISIKAVADPYTDRVQAEPIVSAGAAAIMAAAAAKMTATSTVTAVAGRHSAGRCRRHAERRGCRDCLRPG